MHPRVSAARKSFTAHSQLIRNAIAHYLKRGALSRGFELSRQDHADRLEDAYSRAWALFQRQRDAVELSGTGSLDEQIAERDRRAAFRAAKSAARRVGGRRVRPLGSEVPKGYRDALDPVAKPERMAHYTPSIVQQFAQDDESDTADELWHHVPEALRTTALALAAGIALEDVAAVQGVARSTVWRHKSTLRSVLVYRVLERNLRAGIDVAQSR